MAQLFRYDLWAKTAQGPALAGIQVYVTTQPSNTTAVPPSPLASIFSDPLGASPITQPGVTDGFGHFAFYALAGLYTVTIAIGGVIQNVYPDQNLGNGGLNVTITGSPVAGQALVATSPTTASWQTIAGTTINFPAVPNQFLNSYTAATGMFTSAQPVLSGIGNPTSNVNFIFNANTFTRTYSQSVGAEVLANSNAATSSQNVTSPMLSFVGAVWNGSTSIADSWNLSLITGGGPNPTSTFTFQHIGSSGIGIVSVPNLSVTGNTTFSGIIYDNNGLPGTAGQVLSSTSSGVVWAAGGGGGSGVTSISSNGSLTVSPSTGSVVAILNLGNANTWTATQTFATIAPTTVSGSPIFSGSVLFQGESIFQGTGAFGGLTIIGSLTDDVGSIGTSGQVLSSTGSAVKWLTLPAFTTAGYAGFLGAGLPTTAVYGQSITPATVGTTANQLNVIEFYLQTAFTIRTVSCYVDTAVASSTANFGIYSSLGAKLVDSGAMSTATTGTVTVTLGTAVVLAPGVYYFAQSATSTSVQVAGIAFESAALVGMLNSRGSVKVGQAANATSAGVMPSTLGTISADTLSLNMAGAFFGV